MAPAQPPASPAWSDTWLPGLVVLRGYERSWLRGDVLGGVTVAAYLVPQVMAYAAVAGLDPVTGLWASTGPLLVYAVLGSSRRLSIGPESTTALMTASAVGAMTAGDPDRYAATAAALALAVGVVCLLGRLARLGFLADLLSRPVLVGYMAGIAVLMVVSQLGKLTGMQVEGDTPLSESVYVLQHLDAVRGPTLTMALTVTVALFVAQRLRPRWPNPLIAMLLAALVTWAFDLAQHGVTTVGSIPRGIPVPGLPDISADVLLELALPAIGVAVVGYSDNVLTARAFGAKHHERIDANQEFLALGASNVAAGLMHGFPVSSSASRTVIGEALGRQHAAVVARRARGRRAEHGAARAGAGRVPGGGARRGGGLRRGPARRRRRDATDLPLPQARAAGPGRHHPGGAAARGAPRHRGRHRAVDPRAAGPGGAPARRHPRLRPRGRRHARRRRLPGCGDRAGPGRLPLRLPVVLRQRRGLPPPRDGRGRRGALAGGVVPAERGGQRRGGPHRARRARGPATRAGRARHRRRAGAGQAGPPRGPRRRRVHRAGSGRTAST